MPKVKLSKKQVLALMAESDPIIGQKKPKKVLVEARAQLAKAVAANDGGKEDPFAQQRKMKFIGRKQMEKVLDGLIRKEEIDHVTKAEFLRAVIKRAEVLAESIEKFEPLFATPKVDTVPVKPVAKQA